MDHRAYFDATDALKMHLILLMQISSHLVFLVTDSKHFHWHKLHAWALLVLPHTQEHNIFIHAYIIWENFEGLNYVFVAWKRFFIFFSCQNRDHSHAKNCPYIMTNHSPTSAIIVLLKKITDDEVYKRQLKMTGNQRLKKHIRKPFKFSVLSKADCCTYTVWVSLTHVKIKP